MHKTGKSKICEDICINESSVGVPVAKLPNPADTTIYNEAIAHKTPREIKITNLFSSFTFA